jgi:lipopolysaccharide transport system ATP-binding protein
MGDIAIRVENLSKQYRIGKKQESYKTLRDTLTDIAVAPLRAIRSGLAKEGRPCDNGGNAIWSLKNVSFEVKRGETVGVIGRNGAGKSTLLKILSRITEPTEGWAEIRGRVGSLLEVGTGFHPELTGRENTYLNGAILGMRREEIDRKFDEIVEFAEVGKFIDTPVKHYSSGMHLRLAFAVAAHLEPEILLIDEVLAVGDMAFQKRCLGKMEEVAAAGRTVLFVSHNLGAVKELCQSCIVLNDGRLDFYGPVVKGLVHYSQSVMTGEASGGSARGTGWGHISINKQNGSPKPIPTGEPFVVETELDVSDEMKRARLYCLMDDSNGNGIVHHYIDSQHLDLGPLKAGRYRIRVEFPSLWLMPDAYTLYFKMIGRTASGQDTRRLSERVVIDITDWTGQSVGKVRAVLIPPIRWSLSPE